MYSNTRSPFYYELENVQNFIQTHCNRGLLRNSYYGISDAFNFPRLSRYDFELFLLYPLQTAYFQPSIIGFATSAV